MENSSDLNQVFQALADPTRRAVLERLAGGPASVSELAGEHAMALPSFVQHVRVLERCALIRSQKSGRVRTCELVPETLASAEHWVERQRRFWESRLDALVARAEEKAKSLDDETEGRSGASRATGRQQEES